jgi:hypothetical protein
MRGVNACPIRETRVERPRHRVEAKPLLAPDIGADPARTTCDRGLRLTDASSGSGRGGGGVWGAVRADVDREIRVVG